LDVQGPPQGHTHRRAIRSSGSLLGHGVPSRSSSVAAPGPKADRKSWDATIKLFREAFKT
ncbi:MAG: hypothetical protein ACJ79E_22215, partial [Anaeromyxobacteraceae bacterium]